MAEVGVQDEDAEPGRDPVTWHRRALIGAAPPFAAGAATAAMLAQGLGPAQASEPGVARNILELLSPTEIAGIGKENSTNLMAKVQAAMTANPHTTWYWPGGWYFIDGNVPLSLPPGIRWMGAG